MKTLIGRRAAALDVKANVCTLDDGTRVEYDDCLIATGSSAARAPVPGADGSGVHSFWTLEEARGVLDLDHARQPRGDGRAPASSRSRS